MIILNLLLITTIVVFVIDLTDFVYTIKKFIWKIFHKHTPYTDFSMKPFDCSLCLSWWLMLIYLIVVHSFTIPYIALCALFSFFTPTISNFLLCVQDEINKWLDFIFINNKKK